MKPAAPVPPPVGAEPPHRGRRRVLIDAAGPGASPEAALLLADRLIAARPDLCVSLRLSDAPEGTDGTNNTPSQAADQPGMLPAGPCAGPRSARRLLRQTDTAAVLLLGGSIDAHLLTAAGALDIPVVIAGADAPHLVLPTAGAEGDGPQPDQQPAPQASPAPTLPANAPQPGAGWIARIWHLLRQRRGARGPLASVHAILAPDAEAQRAFQRAGAAPARIEVTGPIEEPSRHTQPNEAERRALARLLGNRPVWVALGSAEAEEDMLAQAHLRALRSAHRLLLIAVPDIPGRGEALADRLRGHHGLATARRGADQDPAEDVQAYVADTEGEAALWLRLAQVVWLGGSSCDAPAGVHPLAAASHGAALVHGLRAGPHAAICQRLSRARASRIAQTPEALATAIEALLSPAEAAAQARAAWDIASAGADSMARLLEILGEIVPPSAP